MNEGGEGEGRGGEGRRRGRGGRAHAPVCSRKTVNMRWRLRANKGHLVHNVDLFLFGSRGGFDFFPAFFVLV